MNTSVWLWVVRTSTSNWNDINLFIPKHKSMWAMLLFDGFVHQNNKILFMDFF